MAWQCAQVQIKRFSQFLEKEQIDIKEYTEHPKHLLSLNSRLPSLNITGKKTHSQLDEPTSGESSPCVSESGRKQRHVAPSVHDVRDYFTNEDTFSEVDYNIEEIQESQRDLSLLIEGLDTSITIDRFLALMAEVRVYTYTVNCIFDTKKYKFLTFKGKHCLLLQIQIKSHTFFSRYVRKLQMHIKNSTGIAVGICVTKKAKHLNGVIVRSLPPKLSHQDLTEKCKKEVGENITVGSIHRIKQSNCCIIDCQYLEDAEKISKKINKSQFRDIKSQECYTVKAHVYPHNTLKHLDKDKSIFAENITFNIEPKITQKPAKSRKAEISRLIDIFANAKDPTPPRNPLTDLTQKENLSRNLTDSSSYIQEIKLKSAKNRVCITSYI